MKYYYFKKESIIHFYKTLNFSEFETISDERRKELDTIALQWEPFFKSQTIGFLSLMTLVSERLTTSAKNFGLTNGDEAAYFFIKLIDPELLFLEVYESANKVQEIKDYCLCNFRIHDKFLIYLEKCYNIRFKDYSPDDLWARDAIKKELIKRD